MNNTNHYVNMNTDKLNTMYLFWLCIFFPRVLFFLLSLPSFEFPSLPLPLRRDLCGRVASPGGSGILQQLLGILL